MQENRGRELNKDEGYDCRSPASLKSPRLSIGRDTKQPQNNDGRQGELELYNKKDGSHYEFPLSIFQKAMHSDNEVQNHVIDSVSQIKQLGEAIYLKRASEQLNSQEMAALTLFQQAEVTGISDKTASFVTGFQKLLAFRNKQSSIDYLAMLVLLFRPNELELLFSLELYLKIARNLPDSGPAESLLNAFMIANRRFLESTNTLLSKLLQEPTQMQLETMLSFKDLQRSQLRLELLKSAVIELLGLDPHKVELTLHKLNQQLPEVYPKELVHLSEVIQSIEDKRYKFCNFNQIVYNASLTRHFRPAKN